MQIYSVSITPFDVGTEDQTTLGFVDNVTVEQYLAEAAQPEGFTLSQSQAKTQGNLRWKFILQSLALMANPYVLDVVANGATISTDATTFTFDVYFERDSAVTCLDVNSNVLTGIDAVQWMIAEALATTYTDVVEYYDPTVTDGYQNGNTVQDDYCDRRVGTLVTGALSDNTTDATANVTVTILA
jgi:hypothetical protein